ncbi:hypothetical protein E2K98_30000 [Bacillus salipaludis]|uniref:CXXC-20-CXXC protein n=1 Tax=Bacillus salipaludis TaxID=2547811 RepID=A0A4R5VHF1_9BACI|nr:hypothetical protein E2K98_30000 [Bacillus salipaludis]
MLRFTGGFFLRIQKCNNCRNQFTWKEIQNASGWGYKKLVCKKCGLEHLITFQSRFLPRLIYAVLIFSNLFLSNVPYALHQTYFGLALLLIFINVLIFPYYAKYKAV